MTEERLKEIEAITHDYWQWKPIIAELIAAVRHLREEKQQLRRDLRDYGAHDPGCPQWAVAFHGSLSAGALLDRGCEVECTCGLEAALGGPEAEEG